MKNIVLVYHHVAEYSGDDPFKDLYVSPRRFERQLLNLVSTGYKPLPLDRMIEAISSRSEMPGKTFCVTFDDACADFIENALPLLEKHGIPATVFVPTGFIGDRNRWDAGSAAKLSKIMSESELRAAQAGNVTLGSHTHNHVHMVKQSAQTVKADLELSFRCLRDIYGVPAPALAFPFGACNSAAVEMAEAAGFRGLCTLHRGVNTLKTPLSALRRYKMTDSGKSQYGTHLLRLFDAYRRLRSGMRRSSDK